MAVKYRLFGFFTFLAVLPFAVLMPGCSGGGSQQVVSAGQSPYEEAVDPEVAAAEKVIQTLPDSGKGHLMLASFYVKQARKTGDFSLNAKARQAVENALAIAPRDADARKLKASLHLTNHEFAEGLKLGEELYAEMPRDAFVLGVLTDAHTQLGNYPKGVEFAQKMVDAKPNSQSYARAAYLRWLHGDHVGAVEMYKLAARTADPADKEAQSWCLTQLGDEHMRGGKYAEAEKVYTEALSILPNYPLALFGKGRSKAATGDLAAAIPLMSGAVERSPHTANLLEFGDVLRHSGNTSSADQIYALADNPELLGDTHDPHRLALFWADNDINLDKALEIAEADYAEIKDIYASDILAWCLYKKGRFQEAQEQSRQALRLGTKDAVIHYHAGMIENALGNRAEAKRLLSTALKTSPEFDTRQAQIARKTLISLN